jgi:Flp pilus assembly protein TadD
MSTRSPALNRSLLVLAAATATLALSACQATTSNMNAQQRSAAINAALEQASNTKSGRTESLAVLENAYKRDSENGDLGTRYGRALREAGRLQRSAIVLAPFADDGKKFPQAKIEYAATEAAMGNYDSAEDYARAALTLTPDNPHAHHILGVALDAQRKHEEAEKEFRTALEHWEGDPAPVLNNLGLNLASQGYIDEALDTLRTAAATAPNREEIERNLRIVSALQPAQQSSAAGNNDEKAPPTPKRKPQG